MPKEHLVFYDFQHLVNIRLSSPLEQVIYLLALHAEHIEGHAEEYTDLEVLQLASWYECAEILEII